LKSSPNLKSLGAGTLHLIQRKPSQIFYAENLEGKRVSLRTKDRTISVKSLHGFNDVVGNMNRAYQIGIAYLSNTDPEAARRTWGEVIDAFIKRSATSQKRRNRVKRTEKSRHALTSTFRGKQTLTLISSTPIGQPGATPKNFCSRFFS
jgi:hypothetical protein